MSTLIKMIVNHHTGTKKYNHSDLRHIFSVDRQVMLKDTNGTGYGDSHYSTHVQECVMVAEDPESVGWND